MGRDMDLANIVAKT